MARASRPDQACLALPSTQASPMESKKSLFHLRGLAAFISTYLRSSAFICGFKILQRRERAMPGRLDDEARRESEQNNAVVQREARIFPGWSKGPGDDLAGHGYAGCDGAARNDIQASLALRLEPRVEPEIVPREARSLAPHAERSKQSHHPLAGYMVEGEVGLAAQIERSFRP